MIGPSFYRGTRGALDSYQANLWFAGGVNQLITGFPASINAENSSNGRDTSIQFGPNGTLDSGQLLAHAPTTATAQDLLDQFAGRSFGSGTSSKQPLVVSGSSYLGLLQFDGTADGINTPQNYGGVSAATVFMRFKLRSTAADQIILEHSINYNNSDAFIVYWDSAASRLMVATHQITGPRYAQSVFNVSVTSEAVFCFRFDRTQATGATQCVLFLNGVKQTRTGAGASETSPVPSGNFQSDQLYLGARQTAIAFATLDLKNLAIYTAALSDADCTAISALL
jgi:hypothetical protein